VTSALAETLLTAEDAPALRDCLRNLLLGDALHIVASERVGPRVHRVLVALDGAERSLVVKRSAPDIVRRNELVARRWLPAVGLEHSGPPLLAVAAERDCERAWHVYEDLPGLPLSAVGPDREHVEATVWAIARVHTAFAGHPLLAECRLWGGDRGIGFYAGNVRDAFAGLRAVAAPEATDVRDELLARMRALEAQLPARAATMAAAGGPETLVHGDLWPTNAIVVSSGDGVAVRLIDWDETGVGPVAYDVATLLGRFERDERPWILDAYRRAVDELAGWRLAPPRELASVMETVAYARLASLLVWSLPRPGEDEPAWLTERLTAVVEWLDQVPPVLPFE
jgi:Ser/Thr protein kinase RdoA (MazF antagonist)